MKIWLLYHTPFPEDSYLVAWWRNKPDAATLKQAGCALTDKQLTKLYAGKNTLDWFLTEAAEGIQ
jgi:hypothetical protein